jgi:transcriptional regulator GlxA family with amidase domain
MRIAVVAYEGFNELDVFANLHLLGRASRIRPEAHMHVQLVGHTPQLRSMYGVDATCQPLSLAREADAVVIGSGGTQAAVRDPGFMAGLRLDPRRQLIASQCSGALVLERLGLLAGSPVCTDATYRPQLEAAGLEVLDQPFFARDNVGSAGGCFASAHLSTWVLWRLLGRTTAEGTLTSVAPVGQEASFVASVVSAVEPYVSNNCGDTKHRSPVDEAL